MYVKAKKQKAALSKARLISARPVALHAPPIPLSTSTKQRPPGAALLARSLSRQICLCLPKYIRTSCPRFSPRNRSLSRSPASQTTRNILQFLLPKPSRLELATCTSAYLAQAHPLDHPLTRDRLFAVLNNNTTTLKLFSFLYPHNACPATFSPSSLPGSPTQPTSSSSA